MKALTYNRYGPPEVVQVSEVPRPDPQPDEILVRVHASAVNTSDWRIRASAFPGIAALPARLIFGLFRPRNQRLGSEFAGVVETVGSQVSKFSPDQRVFGMTPKGGAPQSLSQSPRVMRLPRFQRAFPSSKPLLYLSEASPRWCSLNNSHLSARISAS